MIRLLLLSMVVVVGCQKPASDLAATPRAESLPAAEVMPVGEVLPAAESMPVAEVLPNAEVLPPAEVSIAVTLDFRQQAFAEADEIFFLSYNGKRGGNDDDLELRLHKNGTALITDFGFAVSKENATYSVDADSMLVVTPSNGPPWLPMRIELIDGTLSIIRPIDAELIKASIASGFSKAEVTPEVIAEAFQQWPLRQIEPY